MTTLCKGDMVFNKYSTAKTPGRIIELSVSGMADCALVRFKPGTDALCIPRAALIKCVDSEGQEELT